MPKLIGDHGTLPFSGAAQARDWSTDDVGHDERLSYWIEAVCEAFFELRVDSAAGNAFEGSARLRPLGPLSMIFMQLGPQHVERTKAQASRSKVSQYQLIQYRNHSGLVRQFGREAWIEPGGVTLVDARHPFTIENAAGQDALSISLSVEWLQGWISAPEDVVASVWQAGQGWGGVLSQVLAKLTPDVDGGLELPASVVSGQIGSLLALAAGGDSLPPLQRSDRNALFTRLRDSIRSACHDAKLTPERVARHHGIPVQVLHHQFSAARTSFGDELVAFRLEGAQRMLADQRFRELTIAEIAHRWGFVTTSHLARRFCARFGVLPGEYRAILHSQGRATGSPGA